MGDASGVGKLLVIKSHTVIDPALFILVGQRDLFLFHLPLGDS